MISLSKLIDLTNKTFGKLTVIKLDKERMKALKEQGKQVRTYWICKCECGNYTSVLSEHLRNNKTKSCGECTHHHFINLQGQRFGYLTVISLNKERSDSSCKIWTCKCDCGKIKDIYGCHLVSGKIKSCGCKTNELISERKRKENDLAGLTFGKWEVLKIDEELSNQRDRLYWICKCGCGNIKSVSGGALRSGTTRSCGCCRDISYGEELVKDFLVNNNISYNREVQFKDLGRLRFDFGIYKNKMLIALIEIQGEGHYKPIPYFGGEEKFLKQKERDSRKKKYCIENNIPLIELKYEHNKKLDNQPLISFLEREGLI